MNHTITQSADPSLSQGTDRPGRPSPIAERDAGLALIQMAIEPLVFEAMQADAFGAIDDLTFETAPPRCREVCAEVAQRAVRSVCNLAQDQARRRTSMWLREEIERLTRDLPAIRFASMQEQAVALKTVQAVVDAIFWNPLDRLSDRIVDQYHIELRQPITSSERSQLARSEIRHIAVEAIR